MQLTENFSLVELIASEVAARSGIDNTPPDHLMPNLLTLARGLERMRQALHGRPAHVNSGFRRQRLNKKVGGASGSQHVQGLAADIVCPRFSPSLAICRAIAVAGIPVDQVIHEFGAWCHVSFADGSGRARNELPTIVSAAQGYQAGLNPVG